MQTINVHQQPTAMYLEHFHLHQSPFREEPDPEIFFPEAGRASIYQSLLQDIEQGKPLIKLIGCEGTGKTLLCRRLVDRLSSDYEVVYLDNPVGSFDDLLRIICLDLGMEPRRREGEEPGFDEELRSLLKQWHEKERGVVLILDEAEKLFLATLERLLRVVCDGGVDGRVSILLAGRHGLDTNIDQLTVYCANVDVNAGYTLEPMTRSETENYLRFRLRAAGLAEDQLQELFTPGAVGKIFATAGGNFRLTNILAEESLQNSCSDKSFLVLLDHVAGKNPQEKPSFHLPWQNPVYKAWFLENKKPITIGAAVVPLLLLLLIIFSGGGDGEPGKSIDATENKTVPVMGNGEQNRLPVEGKKAKAAKEKDQENVRRKDSDAGSLPAQVDNSASTKSQGRAENNDPVNEDEIFRERLGASAGWLVGAYQGRHTIQLMTLSSDQAEENIKKMLAQDAYYAIKDDLYILLKKTAPPTLVVFYGTFATMEEARQARNQMAVFLRKHHPYALSISEALEKWED